MGKRVDGSGAVYHRSDGRWEAQLRLPHGGRKSFYARTRDEAVDHLEDGAWMLASHLPVRRTTPTLAEYLDHCLEITRRRVRPSTIESYELNVARISEYLGPLPITRLNPPKIQDAYDRLSERGLSKYSVLQVHRTLHRSLQQAFNWGLIPRNPATATMPPRPEKRQTTALELAELQGLFAAARGHRMFAFWVLLGTTGLRFGEALGLRWRDVHLEERRIVVRQQLGRRKGQGLVFGPLKTAGSRRTVLLTEMAVAALQAHRSQQSIKAATLTGWCDSGLVFTNGLGGPLEPSVPGSSLKRVMRVAALPRIRVHDLRHTTATVLLVAGVHPKVVQDLLGHRTIVVTMDTYSHVMPVLHLQAVQTLNSLLASPSLPDEGAIPDLTTPAA